MPIHEEKYKNAILYLISETDSDVLGKVKLMKLLYYVDFNHFEQLGTSVTGDNYIALENGPVPVKAATILAEMAHDEIITIELVDIGMPHLRTKYTVLRSFVKSVFSSTEFEMLKSVAMKWQHHTTRDIVNASHGEPPWMNTQQGSLIDYNLAKARGRGNDSIEEEDIDMSNWTLEEIQLHERGLLLIAQFEAWEQTNPNFQEWIQRGINEIESGDYTVERFENSD